jgi:tetratricopeptide (TPR) repeat protein
MKFCLCLLAVMIILQFTGSNILNAEKLAIIQLIPDDRDNNKLVYITNEICDVFRKEFAKKGWDVLDEGKTKDAAKSVGVDWGKSEITTDQAMKMRDITSIDYVISGRVTLGDDDSYKVSLLITYTCIGNADKEIEVVTTGEEKDIAKQVNKVDEEIKNLKCSFSGEYISRGKIYYDDENFVDAEKEFKKAIEIDPGNMDAAIYLGSIYYKQKKFDEAITFYSEMLKKNPKNDNLLVALALTYEEMQQEDKALQMYESAALNKSKEKVVYVSLYRLYKKKGMDKKATEALDLLVS